MTSVRVADSVISREIGGTLVVLDVERCAYFQLDRTAAAIWRAIETLGHLESGHRRLRLDIRARLGDRCA